MVKAFMLAVLILGSTFFEAHAQDRSLFEFELGAGYVVGGGTENPGPSTAAVDAALVAWPFRQWGIATRLVIGTGTDLHSSRFEAGLRVGSEDLRYWTITIRNRHPLNDQTTLEIGFGGLLGGSYRHVEEFAGRPRDDSLKISFNGLAIESFVTHEFNRRVGLKLGATFDFNFETNNFQPVALAFVRF